MVLRFSLFALVFLFVSCSDMKFNNPYDPDSPNWIGNSSSSAETVPGSSSPSDAPSSSSVPVQTEIIYGKSVSYQGETYQTVLIGNQTWFKRNLNYNVEGSRCYNDSITNCDKYGRLYNWATAMGIDAKYNNDWWDIDEVKVNEKHKGICPSGWHIPSDAEWTTLADYVGSSAGTKLKATSGWINDRGKPAGNGDDVFGFSALPGGYGTSDGSFYVGYDGYWWSASEYIASLAYFRRMIYINESVNRGGYNKSYLQSVRCLQD